MIKRVEAIVTANQDENKLGRIRVACAEIMGDEEVELPMEIEPSLAWGWFVVPDVGEIVELEYEESSNTDEVRGQTSIDAMNITWNQKRNWTAEETEGENEVRSIPEDFLENYGKRRGFATPNGHILYFDDTEDKQKIQLTWKQSDTYSFLSFDEDGSIILANKNGTHIYLNAKDKALSLVDEHGNSISTDEDGIKIIDKFGNIIETKDGVVQIISQDGIVVTGNSFNAKTGTVDLCDGATSEAVKGTEFKSYFDTHQHNGAFGPTSPPIVLMLPTTLSTVVKLK